MVIITDTCLSGEGFAAHQCCKNGEHVRICHAWRWPPNRLHGHRARGLDGIKLSVHVPTMPKFPGPRITSHHDRTQHHGNVQPSQNSRVLSTDAHQRGHQPFWASVTRGYIRSFNHASPRWVKTPTQLRVHHLPRRIDLMPLVSLKRLVGGPCFGRFDLNSQICTSVLFPAHHPIVTKLRIMHRTARVARASTSHVVPTRRLDHKYSPSLLLCYHTSSPRRPHSHTLSRTLLRLRRSGLRRVRPSRSDKALPHSKFLHVFPQLVLASCSPPPRPWLASTPLMCRSLVASSIALQDGTLNTCTTISFGKKLSMLNLSRKLCVHRARSLTTLHTRCTCALSLQV